MSGGAYVRRPSCDRCANQISVPAAHSLKLLEEIKPQRLGIPRRIHVSVIIQSWSLNKRIPMLQNAVVEDRNDY
jgi:hypothetical protein